MCGISGVINWNGYVEEDIIRKMNFILKHRGPDGEGYWKDSTGHVAFGHRRLGIIDITDGGHQPMMYGEGRYAITYNGEIYNYKTVRKLLSKQGFVFKSDSDTEVVLAAYMHWGESCLQYFEGMFAFAIWDSKERKLFCARDRMGEKPFYYYYDKSRFIFASEMKAIWESGVAREVNNKMLYNYLVSGLHFNINNPSESFFNNIQKLEAAHCLILNFDQKDLRIARYWQIEEKEISSDEVGNVSQYMEMLEDSVKKCLQSDVEIGACLSGGLDSSSILSLMDRNWFRGSKIKTFSARFKNYTYDEGQYIDAMLGSIDVQHHNEFIDQQDLVSNLDKMFYHQEEPYDGASYISEYIIMKKVSENGLKVMLDGQGADEFLGGYTTYLNTILRHTIRHKFYNFPYSIYLYFTNTGGKIPMEASLYLSSVFPHFYRMLKDLRRKRLSHSMVQPAYAEEYGTVYTNGDIHDDLSFHMHENAFRGDLELMLRCSDKSSMAHGVEMRMPFLNHKLINFLYNQPEEYKVNKFCTKYLHREAIKGLVPEQIRLRKDKTGYSAPHYKFITDNGEIHQRIISSVETLIKSDILNKDAASKILRNHRLSWRTMMAANLLKGNTIK